jgi:hypothetical protein
MRNETLTQERLKELLHYDPETGVFTRLKNRRKISSSNKAGYVTIRVLDARYPAHRLAWLYITGSWPLHMIDHINHNGLDNRWNNLRSATPSENQQNQIAPRQQNRLIGAHWNPQKRKFTSAVRVGGVLKHLGHFNTAEAAHEAYVQAKRKHHPFNTL